MVAWATMVWIVSIVVFGLIYTLLWDLYKNFMALALSLGLDSVAYNILYQIMVWLPVAFFLSSTFWLLVMSQRKEAYTP